jgi:5'-3' exonuclease
MHVGIDGDVLLYQSAFAVESRGYIAYDEEGTPVFFTKYKKNVKEFPEVKPYRCVEVGDVEYACNIFNAKVNSIIRKTGATSHTIYLTGKGNFRQELYNGYKASRKDKPLLYKVVRQHAEGLLETVVVDGQEADDALSIAQYKDPEGHIIATIDKDLLMVPGHHYNPNTEVTSYVTPEEGTKAFYKQILTGDSIDDIPGIKGIGPKKAEKILEGMNEEEMWYEVLRQWAGVMQHDSVLETVTMYAQLLWMREKEDEYWMPRYEALI